MKISNTEKMSERSIIACIQGDNNNHTRSKFQAEQTELWEQHGINKTGIK